MLWVVMLAILDSRVDAVVSKSTIVYCTLSVVSSDTDDVVGHRVHDGVPVATVG